MKNDNKKQFGFFCALLFVTFICMLFSLQNTYAVSMCSGSPLLNASIDNPFSWQNGSVTNAGGNNYLFNATNQSSVTDINTACWQAGVPWEPIIISYKPFPNQCTSAYNAICTEDTDNYSSARTYFAINQTKRYCVNTDGQTWRWATANGGLREFQTNYSQICSGGASSIDNACNSAKYFNRTRNGAVNYSVWNYTGTWFIVNQDVAAFAPTCYGKINGTVTDAAGLPINGTNVTLFISGPGTEQIFNSTLTDIYGNYNFNAIPATYYRVLFAKSNYNNEIVNAKTNYTNTTVVNMTLTSGSCNYDCTTQADPSRCSAACNGIAGCAFYNTTFATNLDGTVLGTTKLVTIGSSNYTVTACEGTPTAYVAPSVQTAQISCPAGYTLIVLERIVLKDGQPIKVLIPVCRSSG